MFKERIRTRTDDQRGLSLLELTVVAAIISILAGLTSIAVTGVTSSARDAGRTNDVAEMQKTVDRFEGETAGSYPTPTGSLADSAGSEGVDYFQVIEGVSGINFDLNDDGDIDDTINVITIDWTATNDDGDVFLSKYVARAPKYAQPDEPVTINGNASNNTLSETWVVDEFGTVHVLVSKALY